MAYRNDIDLLGANHLWVLEVSGGDFIGSLTFTNNGGAFAGPVFTEDASASYRTDGTNEDATAPSDPSFQDVQDDLCISFWFQTTAIQQPPCRLVGDGGTTSNVSFLLGFGNSLIAEADCDPDVIQVGSQIALTPNRAYHLCLTFLQIGGGEIQLALYVDGVLQGTAEAADILNTGRDGFQIGGETNTTTFSIGGTNFQLVSPVNGYFAHLCTFISSQVPTATEIREVLFEKGVLPEETLTSDSPDEMQASFTAFNNTTYGDVPLAIRVEPPVGESDLALDATNIKFDEKCSIHVQWTGSGTLTWTNLGTSNASIGSEKEGGTIVFVNPVDLTVGPLIANSEVRVYRAGTETEVAGIESSGTSFTTTLTEDTVDVVVHKEDYEYIRVTNVDLTQGDVSLPIQQRFDRTYSNP